MLAAVLLAASPAVLGVKAVEDCSYWERGGELGPHKACGFVDRAGRLHLSAHHLRRLVFGRGGLAEVWAGGWFYVDRRGLSAPVMTMDNGADPFQSGLARSEFAGKVGFIDRRLRLVVPRRYDGAMPFSGARAAVCTGCRTQADGEHSWYAGGQWLCVDRAGRETASRHEADSGACAARTPAPRLIIRPSWIREPTPDQLRRSLPRETNVAPPDGRVTMSCRVRRDGGLRACIAVEQEPVEAGYATAALRLARWFRMGPTTSDGHPTAGAEVRVAIRFVQSD